MEAIENRSGMLTDNQLFGGEAPLVCLGYLPDDVREKLEMRDAGVTVCPRHQRPCPALNERTGECEATSGCVVEMQRAAAAGTKG